MTTEDGNESLRAIRLQRLQRLQELRRQRDAMVAQDPGGNRKMLIEQHPTALDFAERFDLRTKRTAALELLAKRMRQAVTSNDGRLVVSIPPQEGKTTLLRWQIVWLLCENPDRRIVCISFAQSLARQTGREVRNHLRQHPELCLPLDRSHQDATDWGIEGRSGGLYCVGVGGALTGRPADVLVVDDPLKGREQADSTTVREALHEWWTSVARTRLAPGAPAMVIQTRWHEDDLAGRMAEQGWPLVNIPALADGQTEDALERPVGEWLVSARGRSALDWEQVRADVGERDFAALYQGRPAPLEGGIFKHEWFDTWRVPEERPPRFELVAVGVDPADTGKGDAAGILVAGVTSAGHIVFTADLSAQLSQAQWARKACVAWIRHGAARIVQEHNLGMRTSIPDAWALLYRQAQALADVPDDKLINGDDSRPAPAREELERRGDQQASKLKELWEVLPDFRQILEAGPSGPRVVSITPKQSKRVRAESVAGAFETGRARILGRLPKLEYEACFPAGTLVRTEMGQKPIEQVTTRDRVLTRNGWRAVTWSGQTGVRELLELRTADGHVLKATPNHRVWVEGHGWRQLRFVAPGHRMKVCPGPAPVSTSPSRVGTTPWTSEMATTRPMSGPTPATSSDFSTATSGSRLTDSPFRTVGMFTTMTRTSPTTTRPTSWPCPPASTPDSTPPIGAGQPGTPRLAALGAEKTGLDESQLPARASTVAESSTRPASGPSSATSAVARRTTRSADASGHVRVTTPWYGGLSTTVLSVEPVSGLPVPVYDLTVAGDHEFFAGGLLVHNCTWQEGQPSPNRIDTLAMLTMHLETMRGQVKVSRPHATGDEGGAAVIPLNTARVAGRRASQAPRRAFRMAPLPPNDPRAGGA